jgi:hypothetical protein
VVIAHVKSGYTDVAGLFAYLCFVGYPPKVLIHVTSSQNDAHTEYVWKVRNSKPLCDYRTELTLHSQRK